MAFETTTIAKKTAEKISAEVGDIKIACDSCNPFLGYFGIEEIKVNINIKFE